MPQFEPRRPPFVTPKAHPCHPEWNPGPARRPIGITLRSVMTPAH